MSYYTSSQPQTYTNSLLAARGLDELSAQVSYESARGGVVTALGVEESGLIRFVSCFRDGDFRTRRETRVARANFAAESISRAAKRLARQGYVITALGGNERQGLYLVGTREAGATAQRTISVLQGDTDLHNTPGSGIAPAIEVGTVIAPGARGGSPEWIWIYEN